MRVWVFFAAILISVSSSAQIEFEKNPFEKDKPFEYVPLDTEFWTEYQQLKADKKYDDINSLIANKDLRKMKDNQKSEVYLAFADTAFDQGFPYISLVSIFEINKLFPLSNPSIMSYFIIEKIFANYNIFDDILISESFLDQDIDLANPRIPTEIKSFLGFIYSDVSYQNRYKNKFKKFDTYIVANSQWAYRRDYEKALYELYNNREEDALKIFVSLHENEAVVPYLRNKSQRQVARLLFEKGEFEKSFEHLKTLQAIQDDTGALLLERAWNKYYLKHFSKALGLLTALNDSIFAKTQTPESDVLQMLIYKELCQYDSVLEIKDKYQKRYSKSVALIKNRGNLLEDPLLKRWALQNLNLKKRSSYITGLRTDKKWLKKNFSNSEISKVFEAKATAKERQLDDEISVLLTKEIRKVSEKLLDFNEQVNFLDYQTKVDSLRLKKNSKDVNYRPESISLVTFDRLYWKYEGELWIDEIENLRVLIKSQCEK